MTIISDKAAQSVKGNNYAVARLMAHFNRTEQSIHNWLAAKNQKLALPEVVRIISEETGLQEEEILVHETRSAEA